MVINSLQLCGHQRILLTLTLWNLPHGLLNHFAIRSNAIHFYPVMGLSGQSVLGNTQYSVLTVSISKTGPNIW
jgi:hypothetical protein